MEEQLKGKNVAILVADGTDAGKASDAVDALRGAGADVTVTGPGEKDVRCWSPSGWAEAVTIDLPLDKADADRFDAVFVAGGQIAADTLRANHKAIDLVRRTIENGRPLAVVGHGVWLLTETGLVGGMSVTGTASIRTDLRSAGAQWVDEPVVVENGVVTVRSSDYLGEALPRIIEEFSESRHDRPGITDVVNEASADSFPASDPPSWQPATSAPEEKE